MIELEHSPLGGSGAHRFMVCGGSFLLHRALYEAGELEETTSEYAEIGTGAHELGARCLTENREPFEYIGEEFNGYKVGVPDGISLDAVSVYVDHCRGLMPPDGTGRLMIETSLAHPEVHPYLKGTVDWCHWSSRRGLFLRDYKNGEGVGVSAVNNEQLLYYAFLVILDNPWLRDSAPKDFPVSLGIVQPNFYGVFEEPDIWETTLGRVTEWGQEKLIPRMNELVITQDVDSDDFVTGSHCQFCPVLLDCPKMQAAFRAYAKGSEEVIEMLTDTELDAFYAQRENARRFMNALETTVKARLIGGSEIPSAKLVETRTSRTWKPGAEVALKAAFGDNAYDPRKIKSPAQIEKLSSRGKEMAVEWGFKPDAAKLSVAPLDDPRPAVKGTSNERAFAAFAKPVEDEPQW